MEELMKLTQRHRERGLAIEENAAEREGRIVDWLNAHREAVKVAHSERRRVEYKEP